MEVQELIFQLKQFNPKAELKYINCQNKTLDVQDIKFYTKDKFGFILKVMVL